MAHLYCQDNGRPAVDPVRLFKIMLLGYLFGIKSERQLVKDIEVNVAYRWFLGMSLTEKVIDASTLSQNRFRFKPNAVGLDAGYFTAPVAESLARRKITGVFGYRRPTKGKNSLRKRDFKYDADTDGSIPVLQDNHSFTAPLPEKVIIPINPTPPIARLAHDEHNAPKTKKRSVLLQGIFTKKR